ncbi:MAG: sigma-54 dependent transcriptional regulator [Bacteroidales bacterium]|jgi:DNA-binding NtrC family response regulator|nr:sigma-54 dependent transcriptional regulator [Bacteroidales bacterium]
MSKILVIDDEKAIVRAITEILEYENHQIDTAFNGLEGVNKLKTNDYDLVLCDIKMPKMDGIEVLQHIDIEQKPPMIMISGHGDIATAVECLKLGAADFIEKPLDLNKLLQTINAVLQSPTSVFKHKIKPKYNDTFSPDEIIGKSVVMLEMKRLITKIAKADTAKVLITGGNGSGKELVARSIHAQSRRSNMPFVEINCAAIPNELIESELFGHEKGSFTSAIKQRKGKFEQADGGFLFLDEVGDMNLSAQSKVLRALQEQKITRVGSEKDIKVNVRIIAATNKDLKNEIKLGNFREDLYHRLCVIEIKVPDLNDRREDIPLLIDHFLSQITDKSQHISIDSAAVSALMKLDYSGNVRQLRNIIERLTILCDKKITAKDVKDYAFA